MWTAHGIDGRQPFKCLNPTHNDHNPSMSIDRTSASGLHCKCFACGAYYDIFDLIAIDRGVDQGEAFAIACNMYNIQPEGGFTYRQSAASAFGKPATVPGNQKQAGNEQITQPQLHNSNYTTGADTIGELQAALSLDIDGELLAAHAALMSNPAALEHFTRRGLSREIIERYKLGYSEGGHNAPLKAYTGNQSKGKKAGLYKYLFPYTNAGGRLDYYISEISDRGQIDEYNGKYRKLNKAEGDKSASPIFNERYIKQGTPPIIFICEGIFDALSVEEAGSAAIAFVGTAHRRFLQLCKEYKPQTTFIVSLDNDSAGAQAIEKVTEGLKLLGIPYIVRTAEAVGAKDFNEALTKDRAAFVDFIRRATSEAGQAEQEQLEEERTDYKNEHQAAARLQGFINRIIESKTAIYYPTGFRDLDVLLDGGFYTGLYILGAISSLGKTTFCLQVIDNIAAGGHDVLIFSLEMAERELMAKSISRLTLQEDLRQYQDTKHAKTVRGILTGSRYANYSREENSIIQAAIERYNEYAGNIYIFEGIGDIGVMNIREQIERHVKLTGRKPVVFIDYAQILAAYNERERATDKQNVDKNVLELKRISRDFDIPVLAISSFNRDSYSEPVSMAAFKESGAIEYSSDVLIGLQYYGMDYKEGEGQVGHNSRVRKLIAAQSDIAASGKPQDIQIKILKNRNGRRDFARLDYYPMFNYFKDSECKDEDGEEGEWKPATKKSKSKPEDLTAPGDFEYIPIDGHEPGDFVQIKRKQTTMDDILEEF